MKYLLLDESAVKELLDAYGHDFARGENQRIQRFFTLAREIVSSIPVDHRPLHFGRGPDYGRDILDSVRLVSLPDGARLVDANCYTLPDGSCVGVNCMHDSIGGHDAPAAAKDSRDSQDTEQG